METLNESLILRWKLEDRLGMARSYRKVAWVRFYQGLEHDTIEAAETALAMQRKFGDRQGIADGRFFLALSLLCCGELAVAASYPQCSDSWVSYLPEVMQLEQTLREQLLPAEFEQAWIQGQALKIECRRSRATYCGLKSIFFAFHSLLITIASPPL